MFVCCCPCENHSERLLKAQVSAVRPLFSQNMYYVLEFGLQFLLMMNEGLLSFCVCVCVTESHASLTEKHATLATGGLEVEFIHK